MQRLAVAALCLLALPDTATAPAAAAPTAQASLASSLATANQIYAVAIGKGTGGVIEYRTGPDRTIDGRFVYYQGRGNIDGESGRAISKGQGLAGTYSTSGTLNGKTYTDNLTITLQGHDSATGFDFYELGWINGDRGHAFGYGSRLFATFGDAKPGFISYEAGKPAQFYVVSWENGHASVVGYEFPATNLDGTHQLRMTAGRAQAQETMTVTPFGQAHRLSFGSGDKGLALEVREQPRPGTAIANAPSTPARPAAVPAAPVASSPVTAATLPSLTPIRVGQIIQASLGEGDYLNADDSYREDYEVSAPPGSQIDVVFASKELLVDLAVGVDADGGCRAICKEGKADTVDFNNTVRGFTVPAGGKVLIRLSGSYPGADGPYTLAVLSAGGAASAVAKQKETLIKLGQTMNGELTAADPKLDDERAYDVYMLERQTPGKKVQVTVRSTAFATVMVAGPLVVAGRCTSLTKGACTVNNGGAGGNNSRLTLAVPESGYLWISLTGLTSFVARGAYTIEVIPAP